MENPEFHQLGDTSERLIRMSRESGDGFAATWGSLTGSQQLMVVRGLAAMVAHLRAERGDPPDAIHAPRD